MIARSYCDETLPNSRRQTVIVTDRQLISKEFIGECLTYSISVLPKLKLKNVPVFLSKLQFIGISRTNLKEKKPDFFTL